MLTKQIIVNKKFTISHIKTYLFSGLRSLLPGDSTVATILEFLFVAPTAAALLPLPSATSATLSLPPLKIFLKAAATFSFDREGILLIYCLFS